MTINELLTRYFAWAEDYYRYEPSPGDNELGNIRAAMKPLQQLYGDAEAIAFGPVAARAVQAHLVKSGLSRKVVNARINRIRRAFKWAVSFELIPPSVHEALRTLPGLQFGRGGAREAPGVVPVAHEHVLATLPFLSAAVRAMVELQWLSGARPGEIRIMRAIDINMSGDVWSYRPSKHKNSHRGLDRVIFLGKQAQQILKPFLTTDLGVATEPSAYLFSPRTTVAVILQTRAAQRTTKVTPSERARKRAANGKRRRKYPTVGNCYTRRAYCIAIQRAAKKAGVPHWSALQLRHSAATNIRTKFGLEAAQSILGHQKLETTQIYAERSMDAAEKIMREIG
jgi:integrase